MRNNSSAIGSRAETAHAMGNRIRYRNQDIFKHINFKTQNWYWWIPLKYNIFQLDLPQTSLFNNVCTHRGVPCSVHVRAYFYMLRDVCFLVYPIHLPTYLPSYTFLLLLFFPIYLPTYLQPPQSLYYILR